MKALKLLASLLALSACGFMAGRDFAIHRTGYAWTWAAVTALWVLAALGRGMADDE